MSGLRSLRPIAWWVLVIGAGIALLHARYDWSQGGGRFADRGFALSSYLFAIALPTAFYLARRFLHSTAAAVGITALFFAATTVPYNLLGLDRIAYYRDRPLYFRRPGLPSSLEFLPGGTLRAFPYDWLFMPLLFATAAAIIWLAWWLRKRAGISAARVVPVLLTVAFAAICMQTFVHSSKRAPYTYVNYFVLPKVKQNWYQVFHFRDASGATNADQFAFTPLEFYFQGVPRSGDNELIRRPFSFYLASQASYFVNTFYVWLGLNALFWLAAVAATGRLVARLATPRAGVIAGALTVFGPGFVAFAGTPAMYLQYYAAVAVALCLFEELVVRHRGQDRGEVLLFTGALALCGLVYDLGPLFLVLLAYGLARRVSVRPLIVSLAAAFLAVRGFTFLVTDVLDITVKATNSKQLSDAVTQFKDFALHPQIASWYDATVSVVPHYVALLLQAFFVVPVVVALFGLRKLRDRPLAVLVGALFATSLATIAVLQIGGTVLALPRLVFPIFPAVFLLVALALDAGNPSGQVAPRFRWPRALTAARAAAPWVVVGTMAFLANVDILGHPTLYVEFLTGKPPVFLP